MELLNKIQRIKGLISEQLPPQQYSSNLPPQQTTPTGGEFAKQRFEAWKRAITNK